VEILSDFGVGSGDPLLQLSSSFCHIVHCDTLKVGGGFFGGALWLSLLPPWSLIESESRSLKVWFLSVQL
jgi:hypothetical protein